MSGGGRVGPEHLRGSLVDAELVDGKLFEKKDTGSWALRNFGECHTADHFFSSVSCLFTQNSES